jgi:transposase InsO family protein
MWAIDGTQIPTVHDGKVWLFGVAEHWNAELVGWHVTKQGTRHEALQAMSMAVSEQFGHLGRDAARGLALRHDHGSAFMSEDFQRQVKAWGMTPSYAFVAQPETNGVIERLFRTFKEQVVYGRIFQTIEEVRDAVRTFGSQPQGGRVVQTIVQGTGCGTVGNLPLAGPEPDASQPFPQSLCRPAALALGAELAEKAC